MTAPTVDKSATDKTKLCLCGCGEVTNPNRDFKQGHDQRLVSILATDLAETGGSLLGFDALPAAWQPPDLAARIEQARRSVADKFSAGLADKFASAAANKASKAKAKIRKDKKATETKPAETPTALDRLANAIPPAPPEPEKIANGSTVHFKVGKRPKVYEGEVVGMNQAGKVTSVRYRTNAGTEQVTQNFLLVTQ